MKKVLWRKLFLKTFVWLITELLLNLIGIDDLADYSEFLFENRTSNSASLGVANIALVL
ncbi:hypothetical protein [Mastigocoleus testarum]|uniref:hypothetical protein n=1 Tax=Mastigocoleus testarum TaxID=996925 RepID=UPI0004148321|nr:hypothetical protein [Mastigocoleus testarum]